MVIAALFVSWADLHLPRINEQSLLHILGWLPCALL